MSIYSTPINTIEIPWKIFITGTNEVESNDEPKQFANKLNFSGTEAHDIYNQIIQEQTTNPVPKHKPKEDKKSTIVSVNTNINVVSPKAMTVNSIMKAVEQRDLTFLKDHIHAENVNNTDSFGWTPLMLAAYCGFADIVDFLLKSGANRKFREKSGLTAAQLALKKNYLDVVALLRKNASAICDNVNFEDLNLNNKEQDNKKEKEVEKETEFYCTFCKGKFKSQSHESSILHLFNTKSKLPSAFFGISKASKGYQMLLSSGWDEESGLGREGKGQKYPVKTVLKLDRKGLGMPGKVESRITHFGAGDASAVKPKVYQNKVATKKDREKLLNRDARKERALRIALS